MTFSREQLDGLAASRTVTLTTFGRRSGRPRRIEIWWFRVDGRFVITGTPGKRDWFANILSNPSVIVSVNGFDIEGTAAPVYDPSFRTRVFTNPHISWYSTQTQLETLVATAPMVEIDLQLA